MKRFYLEERIFGYPVFCDVSILDNGIHALVMGGCSTHIGSVSVMEPGQEPRSTLFPGHKDHIIGDKWAKALADKYNVRAAVVCGIHFDKLSPDGINAVVVLSDRMLKEFLETVSEG